MRTSRKKRENFQRLVLSDRYDGRGHLHDLAEYDAEHNSWNRNYNISEEEARIEALCDEERYLALHTDLLEEEARQEEEYKRLSEALAEDGTYNSVCFKYRSDYYDPSQPTEEEEPQKEEKDSSDTEDNEEPFIAPEGMNVPSDVELPATAKMHAIIERTANFVCKQGAQFEIMLKAKQARNSQFDFLRFDHYLNPYYKHILRAMKEGRYTMLAEKTNEQKKTVVDTVEDSDDDDEGGDYLHPSLFASKRCSRLEELTKPLKVIDPDHPLAALVRKAQSENMASQLAANAAAAPAPPPATQTESTTETTVPSAYYNYYMLPDGTYCFAPPPPGMDASYSSIPAGENATKEAAIPPPSTILPPLSSSDDSNKVPAGLSATSTLAPVVAIIPPPPDIQPVIDKLAQYVARNGIKFETSVRAKNDSRFDFLQPWHQYNPYYEFKKQFFMQKEGIPSQPYTSPDDNIISTESLDDPVMPNDTVDDETNAGEASSAKDDASSSNKAVCDGKMKVSFAPISFAIRVKETDLLPFEKNRVKLDDDSEEEEQGDAKDGQQNKTSTSSNSQSLNTPTIVEEKKPQLTPEELEAKQAKQKLEDRLAAAAREKLAQAAKESKEKQLQAERKRKAALFLQTLKSPLEVELGRTEESNYSQEVGSTMNYGLLPEDTIVPTTEYPITSRSPTQEYSRTEREKKKKKKKKRSRSRSHSPKIHYESKSRSHSKVKHSLPTAYRTVRRSRQAGKDLDHVTAVYQLGKRSRSRSPRKVSQSSERRREDDRAVSCSYRVGYAPGNSRKRSRSPHENRKKKHSRSESKSKVRASSRSPSRHGTHSSTHSTSISPVESRGSSQERYRENAQDKDGHITSEIVSSVQSKITQDLMAKVRAMLAASKKMHSSAS
ncbi:splicing factor, suppressor of white-apricot homolog isoform X3 [Rana temporaria]|uniref:splicing factor, suppressor of white-apricot homolog isoform X3 n=1 Tax=Rana temporaria TaxID=8407 RepID=UPI001AAC9539|nr:splicing factor, suppressor of white-apricot homolog isoform X3 [Rana temporaria]